MGVNKKVFIFYGLIILALWTGNVIYYMTGAIKEPLFIKQYTEAELYPNEGFSIYYMITDEEDRIGNVIFPEISNAEIWVENESIATEGRYIIKRIFIEKNMFLHYYPQLKEWVEDPEEEPIKLTQMITRSLKGEEGEVDIGEVYLFPASGMKEDLLCEPMERESSRNDEKWEIRTVSMVKQNIQVAEPTSLLIKEIENFFDIFINGTLLEEVRFPISMETGEKLTVVYKSKENMSLTKMFSTGLNFRVEDEEGRQEVLESRIFRSIHHLPYYERSFIQALKKEEN